MKVIKKGTHQSVRNVFYVLLSIAFVLHNIMFCVDLFVLHNVSIMRYMGEGAIVFSDTVDGIEPHVLGIGAALVLSSYCLSVAAKVITSVSDNLYAFTLFAK